MGRNKKDLIWKTTDYKARAVSLYVQERDHICNHQMMQNNFNAVYDTVSSPDSVYASSQNSNREVFFKASAEATYYRSCITKVIVEYPMNGDEGHVVTAFPQKKEEGGINEKLYSK